MPKTLTPASIVAAAEAEAVAAEQTAAELRAAVEDGDTAVTPAALAEAEQKGVFARLRIKAAQKEAAKVAEADRIARAEAVAADARALVEQDDAEDLAVKMRAAVDALAALYATAADRHARIRDMVNRVGVIRSEAERAGVADPRGAYGVGRSPDFGEVGLTVGKADPIVVRSVSPAEVVAAAVALATPKGEATPPVPASQANRVRARVPAVAAAFPAA